MYTDVKVPKENRIGEDGFGFKFAMKVLSGGRIGIAAQALGIAAGAYELAVKYAKEREAFGRPIGQHQAIAFKLADMATEIEAARLLVYRAAIMKDQGLDYTTAASMAKLFASEVAMRHSVEAVQVHGGYGYVKEYHVERLMRDAKITQIYEGTSEMQRIVISRAVWPANCTNRYFFRKDNSVTLGRNHHHWDIFQYPLKLHWSFALLLAYVLFNVVTNDSFTIVGIVAFLFLCVVLHEYGHALMAKRFKVNTKDIILSPIGGVARLERLPEKPAQELVIALAGPAVNLLLASLLLLVLVLTGFDWNTVQNPGVVTPDFTDYLVIGLYINVMLFGFNLVPAFPMDGGRVLRSLLALKYGRSKATQIAGWVGRIIALFLLPTDFIIGIIYLPSWAYLSL